MSSRTTKYLAKIARENSRSEFKWEVALGMIDYAWNQVSNEILYWTGN